MTIASRYDLPEILLGARVTVARPESLDVSTSGLDETTLRRNPGYPRVWSDGDGRAVIWYEGIGHYVLTGGRLVVFHPEPGVSAELAVAGLHSSAPTLLLAQQGRFALHASTVDVDGVRIAIAGRSGAGKSTTSLALVQRGATPLVDDISVLDVVDGHVVTQSFGRKAHVFPHVLEELGIDPSLGRPMGGPRNKVALEWPDAPATPVEIVVVLRPGPVPSPELHHLAGPAAIQALARVTHMRATLQRTHHDALFAWHAAVSGAVRVAVLRRPADGWPLADICLRLEQFAAATLSEIRTGPARS